MIRKRYTLEIEKFTEKDLQHTGDNRDSTQCL